VKAFKTESLLVLICFKIENGVFIQIELYIDEALKSQQVCIVELKPTNYKQAIISSDTIEGTQIKLSVHADHCLCLIKSRFHTYM